MELQTNEEMGTVRILADVKPSVKAKLHQIKKIEDKTIREILEEFITQRYDELKQAD